MVALSVDERTEIQRTSPYYSEKVFEYPSLVEAARAYPGEPDSSHLLAAAEKLVNDLYQPCQQAA